MHVLMEVFVAVVREVTAAAAVLRPTECPTGAQIQGLGIDLWQRSVFLPPMSGRLIGPYMAAATIDAYPSLGSSRPAPAGVRVNTLGLYLRYGLWRGQLRAWQDL